MNLFLLDNNRAVLNVFTSIPAKSKVLSRFFDCDEDLSSIASNVKQNIEDPDLILINVHPFRKDEPRQSQPGIRLLKFLRLQGVFNHCLLYSFLDSETILRQKKENYILLSKGTSFIRLPEGTNSVDFKTLSQNKATRNDLKTYFKLEVNLPTDDRHNWANWWGVKQLWDVHCLITNNELKSDYPNAIKEKLKELRSQQVLFLYGYNELSISDLSNGAVAKNNVQGPGDSSPLEEIAEKRNRIKNARILLIDDQANEGWSDVLSLILYGEISSANGNLHVVEPRIPSREVIEKAIARLYREDIQPLLATEDYDLIILDLRLMKERGVHYQVELLSGALMQSLIRDDHPGFPILIFTASNKFYSYKALTKLNIDGFWHKEGIDEHLDPFHCMSNYFDLIDLIWKLTGKEFQFYRRLQEALKKLKNENGFWWENKEWDIDGLSSRGLPRVVFSLFDSSVFLFHQLLQGGIIDYSGLSSLKYSDKQMKKLKELAYAMINRLGCIVEHIHHYDSGKIDINDIGGYFNKVGVRAWIPKRKDYLAQFLYHIRNNASHFNEDLVAFDDLRVILISFVVWLSNPFIELRPPNYWDYTQRPDGKIDTRSWKEQIANLKALLKANRDIILKEKSISINLDNLR